MAVRSKVLPELVITGSSKSSPVSGQRISLATRALRGVEIGARFLGLFGESSAVPSSTTASSGR